MLWILAIVWLLMYCVCAELTGRQKPNGGLVEWLAYKLNVIEIDKGSVHMIEYNNVCLFLYIYMCVCISA